MQRIIRALIFVASLAAAGTLQAHHSFPAVYDAKVRQTVSGIVTQMLYQNPHARVYLRVKNEDGSEDIWEARDPEHELPAARRLAAEDPVQPGDHLTIEGNVAFKIPKRLYIQVVTQENGHVLWVQDPAPLREEGYLPPTPTEPAK